MIRSRDKVFHREIPAEPAERTVSLPRGERVLALFAYPVRESGPGMLVVHDASARVPF